MASEVRTDLGNKLSDLKYVCSNVFMISISHYFKDVQEADCRLLTRQEVLPTRICSKTHIRSKRKWGRTGPENWSDMHFAANSGRQCLIPGQMVVQMTQASTETRWYKRINSVVWVLGCLVLSTCYSGVHISPQLLSVIQQADLSLW